MASKQAVAKAGNGRKSAHDDDVVRIDFNTNVSWRLRDTAHRLLYHRLPADDTVVAPRQSSSSMFMSRHFDGETCLAKIRRDRADVVRSAFDAAATAVLEAVEKAKRQHGGKQRRKSLTFQPSDLPNCLSQLLELQEVRLASMERAHNNKEYAKKPLPPDSKRTRKPKDGDLAAVVSSGITAKDEPVIEAKEVTAAASSQTREAPKFTRNTPASSAAALDSRSNTSRAILCTAGNVAFDALTPTFPGFDINVTDIPQNPSKQQQEESDSLASSLNMGNVVVEAQTLGQRAIAVAENASRRAAQRYRYRKDNLRFDSKRHQKSIFRMKNPFRWRENGAMSDKDEANDYLENSLIRYNPHDDAITETWTDLCLPRFVSILTTGAGNALYHDVHWSTRHGRIANLLQVLAHEQENYGTHLIITTEPDVPRFAQEFHSVNHHLSLLKTVDIESLRALPYTGDKEQRRKLRHFFPKATGLIDSPYHVIITSYASFLENYLHFCQVPFEIVVLDDGAAWMAAARCDPNSPIGTIFNSSIWSTKDHVGLAGTGYKKWDFMTDDISEKVVKNAWIGLTARNRIMTASTMKLPQRFPGLLPIPGLVDFLSPHFATAVREEWDRSRITTDSASMDHFLKLVARSVCVHHPQGEQDLRSLALNALSGNLPQPNRSRDPEVPEVLSDEVFVASNKVAYSRRHGLGWLGPPETSWLRFHLGKTVAFDSIINLLQESNSFGHFCEEIITASSTTTSGATGQVAGTLAYRLAVRCNRHFGSEQGLRQHLSALHAPPGTWICRTCGVDCITSQARTHHERSCGQPTGAGDSKDSKSGQGARQHYGPVGVVGKKKGQRPGAPGQGGATVEDKDPDGSFRVPGYRGVWVNPKGKHFVKVKGKKLTVPEGDTLYFDSIEEAAKGHDRAVKEQGNDPKVELNYKEDGSRIVYEDVTTSSSTGLGGSASNVVPALSVINIKDLPPDVKPLLRDPRQTSRTGGNSKRHVYAYRGVCRQARKGHDRWQSQISFMGVNHYLGTFDSEWDAAAIYAWAHLILYGEEATKKAQKEGEEAAAAYEQEKKDIAEGKIVLSPPKSEKKQKKPKKTKGKKAIREGEDTKAQSESAKSGKKVEHSSKKRKLPVEGDDENGESKKRAKSALKIDKQESIAPILAKGVGRAYSLAPREMYTNYSDAQLIEDAVKRLSVARDTNYCVTDKNLPAGVDDMLRPCFPEKPSSSSGFEGAAVLLGLSSVLFGWDVDVFVSSRVFDSPEQERDATATLNAEYCEGGINESFWTIIQGPLCIIGNASPTTRKAHKSLGLNKIPMGSAVAGIDCHIGGTMLSCSEQAATIRFAPTSAGEFQFAAVTDDDIVTLNGKRITPGMGSFPLFSEDICTVGARAFVFLLPGSSK